MSPNLLKNNSLYITSYFHFIRDVFYIVIYCINDNTILDISELYIVRLNTI